MTGSLEMIDIIGVARYGFFWRVCLVHEKRCDDTYGMVRGIILDFSIGYTGLEPMILVSLNLLINLEMEPLPLEL